MSERINLTEIEARRVRVCGNWPLYGDFAVHLVRTDLPDLIAWVREAGAALVVARDDAERDAIVGLRSREEWNARVSRYDALLSRLEGKP